MENFDLLFKFFSRMKESLLDTRKRLARAVVTWQANRLYRKGVKMADERHRHERTRIYVAVDPMNERRLATFDRKQFRQVKRILGYGGWKQQLYTVSDMKAGAFYYTGDKVGNGTLCDYDKQLRRLAFVRLNLERAKLL